MSAKEATGKTTKESNAAIVAQLEARMEERGYSQSAVAKAVGYSASALNQWLGGKYNGDVNSLESAIESWLLRDMEREKSRKIKLPFVMTSIAAKVFEAARMCHLDSEIGVAYGGAGIGKTLAVKEYAARNSDVILIEADLSYTVRDVFVELHKACGFTGDGSVNKMKDDVISKLKDTGRLIIIDEAEHLPVRALDLLRRVYDKAGVGILFVGLHRFMESLRVKQADFAYLYTRVGFKVALDILKAADVETIVKTSISGSNGVWKSFYEESHGNGRILSKLLSRTIRLADVNGISVSPELVREASKMLAV